jgi:hypothetical protein
MCLHHTGGGDPLCSGRGAGGGFLFLQLNPSAAHKSFACIMQVEVIRFAVDAVRAEAFNAKTLFLFGSYTIGKERLFLEVARQLRMKARQTASWTAN